MNCTICGKYFSRKYNLVRHLQKKSKCTTLNETNELECSHCNKKFKYKNSYYRHTKNYCKVLKEKKYHLELLENNLDLKKDLKKVLNKLDKKEQTKQLVVNDTIEKINDFGNEDISDIDVEEWEEIASSGLKIISAAIKHIHIDREKNRNIFVPSVKDKYIMTLQNNEWCLVNRLNTMKLLIAQVNVLLRDIIDEYGDKFVKIDPAKVRNILYYCGSDSEAMNKVNDDTILLLFNNNNMVKNTYEKNYGKKIRSR